MVSTRISCISILALIGVAGSAFAQKIEQIQTSIQSARAGQLPILDEVVEINNSPQIINSVYKTGATVASHINFNSPIQMGISAEASDQDLIKGSYWIIKELNNELRIDEPSVELIHNKTQKHNNFTHLSFNQSYQGIPIYDAELKLHYNRNFELVSINGSTIKTPSSINIVPQISSNDAIALCVEGFENDSKNFGHHSPRAELVIYNHFGLSMLCWKVNVYEQDDIDWEIIVSATSGKELLKFNTICHGHPIKIDGVRAYDNKRNDVSLNTTSIQTYKVGSEYILFDGSHSEVDHNIDLANDPAKAGGVMLWDASQSSKGQVQIYPFKISSASSNQSELLTKWLDKYSNKEPQFTFEKAVTCQNHLTNIYSQLENPNYFAYKGLDGINGQAIKVYVDYVTPRLENNGTYKNIGYDGGFWRSEDGVIVLGKGYDKFKSSAASLDFIAHEYTHGIVANTAKLRNNGESHSINEAFADIMAMVLSGKASKEYTAGSGTQWLFGSQLINDYLIHRSLESLGGSNAKELYAYTRRAIRNIGDPHNGFTKKDLGYHYGHLSEIGSGVENPDWEVYRKSTIISHAFYKVLWEIPNGTGVVGAWDSKNMAKHFFNAVRFYLTPNANFVDFVVAVQDACNAAGAYSAKTAIIKAFEAVGLPVPDKSENIVKLPPVVGDSYILTTRINSNNPGISTYTINYSEDQKMLESLDLPKTEISATDNGKTGYYIDEHGQIQKVDFSLIDSKNPGQIQTEQILAGIENKWSKIAVSPNGARLALTSETTDTSLYIFNFDDNGLYRFRLNSFYNISSRGDSKESVQPVRIEQMNWSYDGQDLLFDCMGMANLNSEQKFHWNIAKMNVWDSTTNTATEGKLTTPLAGKLLPYLHYRNPRFAKNRPSVIVFDQYNEKSKENQITIYDMARPDSGLKELTMIKSMGHPCFTHDDRRVVYTTVNSIGDTILKALYVDVNAMTALPVSHDFVASQRKLPTWLTIGTRPILAAGIETKPEIESQEVQFYPNPANDQINISVSSNIQSITVYDMQGREMLLTYNLVNNQISQINISQLPSGIYNCFIKTDQRLFQKRLVKQ